MPKTIKVGIQVLHRKKKGCNIGKVMLVVTFCLAVECLNAAWNHGDPVVAYWAGPGFPGAAKLTEASLLQLREGGWNTVWATSPAELDLAAKFGMRCIYAVPGGISKISDPKREETIGKVIDRVKDHPALYVYLLADEPSFGWFNGLYSTKKWLQGRDSNHAAWINLLPSYATNKQLGMGGEIVSAYREYVHRFCEMVKPEFFSFDHYQFNWKGDTQGFLMNLDIARERANSIGVPFWVGIQACSSSSPQKDVASPPCSREVGPEELRYLAWTSAAYGARGIYHFVYSHPEFKGGIATTKGDTGRNYEALKTINREFVALASELASLTFTGAWMQGQVAPGVEPYCGKAMLTITPSAPMTYPSGGEFLGPYSDSTLITRFDAPGAPTHLVVVNMDYTKERTIHVKAPAQLERFDALKGEWSSVGSNETDLALPKGGGFLLRLVQKSV